MGGFDYANYKENALRTPEMIEQNERTKTERIILRKAFVGLGLEIYDLENETQNTRSQQEIYNIMRAGTRD